MKKRIYKPCRQCGQTGWVKSHTPDKESLMFGLLDFGVSAVYKTIRGRDVVCPNCAGEGVVLDRIEIT